MENIVFENEWCDGGPHTTRTIRLDCTACFQTACTHQTKALYRNVNVDLRELGDRVPELRPRPAFSANSSPLCCICLQSVRCWKVDVQWSGSLYQSHEPHATQKIHVLTQLHPFEPTSCRALHRNPMTHLTHGPPGE